jgi:hypothetical protein
MSSDVRENMCGAPMSHMCSIARQPNATFNVDRHHDQVWSGVHVFFRKRALKKTKIYIYIYIRCKIANACRIRCGTVLSGGRRTRAMRSACISYTHTYLSSSCADHQS